MGGSCWRKSRRSWQARLQAPPGLRRQWPAADGRGDGGQRQRQHHVRGADGRRAGGAHPSGRRRCRPGAVHADKGYDARHCRAYLRRRGINARIARRGIESSKRLGRYRWRVERALSWLSCFRRLQVRWDRDSGRFFAFVLLACALVCGNRLWSPGHAGGVAVVGGATATEDGSVLGAQGAGGVGGGQPGRAGACLRSAEDVPQLLRQVRSATRRSARTHCTSCASRSSTRAPGTGDRPRLVGGLWCG
jgi:transposase